MKNIIHKHVLNNLWALALLTAGLAHGQTGFELLETPVEPGQTHFSLSRDGSAMGCILGGAVYWWSYDQGFRALDSGQINYGGVGMSGGGQAMVAAKQVGKGTLATIWYADGTSLVLESMLKGCDREGVSCAGFDISSAGKDVVGMAANCQTSQAFHWDQKSGVNPLANVGNQTSAGLAISADGAWVVGYSQLPDSETTHPACWHNGRPVAEFPASGLNGKALNVSLNGQYIVGQANFGHPNTGGFVWSAELGLKELGPLPGKAADPIVASAVSDAGWVVGWSGDEITGEQVAIIWSAASGIMPMADFLGANDISLPSGLHLTAALDISGDGTTIVGTSRDAEYKPGCWRLALDQPQGLGPDDLPAEDIPEITADRDSLYFDQADMLLPFPFGKRGNKNHPLP